MAGLKNAVGIPVEETEITPENHLVLMASNRLERARELSELQGSFMTANLCSALGQEFEQADRDSDSRLSIEDLKKWLEIRAREHNQKAPDRPVPYPFLFGQKRGEFYLTRAPEPWNPYEIESPDGTTFVVLPRPQRGTVLCLAKFPVTNSQYRRFVESTDDGAIVEPEGKRWSVGDDGIGRWEGPFFPWQDDNFNADDQPVVCVSYDDALAYVDWVNELLDDDDMEVSLATTPLWDFAAFGTEFPDRNPATWLSRTKEIHHMSSCPARLDRDI